MRMRPIAFLAVLILPLALISQSSADLLHQMRKLQNPARVLYLAAHPDDENTRLIAYLTNGAKVETAYLSLTRGDGGQNLIGNELGDLLGVIRTQELMQARKTDGGRQFFTRAVDFGYSKTAEESLDKWGKDSVLHDVIYVIRQYKPHLIITRFPPDERAGHGHHTASAMLAEMALPLAADPNYQTTPKSEPWQVERLFWNTSPWWGVDLDGYRAKGILYELEVGGYEANLGQSYNEIASHSRTQHKSQGFGVQIARGSQMEYLVHTAGDTAQADIFEGVPTVYAQFGAPKLDKLIQKWISNYDPLHPQKSLSTIPQLRELAVQIKDGFERESFLERLSALEIQLSGIYGEALAQAEKYSLGDTLKLSFNLLQRLPVNSVLRKISVLDESGEVHWQGDYTDSLSNDFLQIEGRIYLEDLPLSQPYWLRKPHGDLFRLENPAFLSQAEAPASLRAQFTVEIEGRYLVFSSPVEYSSTDRVEGELRKPVILTPPLTVEVTEDNLIFTSNKAQTLEIKLQAQRLESFELSFAAEGFAIEPSSYSFNPTKEKEVRVLRLSIQPLDSQSVARISMKANGESLYEMRELDYAHIDKRVVFEPATPKLVRMKLQKKGSQVGYIIGAGDEVAAGIRQMGYEVDELNESSLYSYDLSMYKAIVIGIRAYNTVDWLPAAKARLMEYVRNGGVLIVQYNTSSRDLLSEDIGPYPFSISRKRVTEEDAAVQFTLPSHALLNKPNVLTQADFEQWVQERGLYFADSWDAAYQTPLSWNDAGEEPLSGGLLIADYGQGAFMYTGISFFRQLPAGVPGAYRLLANMISYKAKRP